jgi:hypothetical protein
MWRPVKEAMGCLQGRKRPGRSGHSEVWILILMPRTAKGGELGDHLQRVYPRCGEVADRGWVVYPSLNAQPRWLQGDWVRAPGWEKEVGCLCTRQVQTFCMRSWRIRGPTVDHRHDLRHHSVLGQLLQALDLAKFDHRRERRCNR